MQVWLAVCILGLMDDRKDHIIVIELQCLASSTNEKKKEEDQISYLFCVRVREDTRTHGHMDTRTHGHTGTCEQGCAMSLVRAHRAPGMRRIHWCSRACVSVIENTKERPEVPPRSESTRSTRRQRCTKTQGMRCSAARTFQRVRSGPARLQRGVPTRQGICSATPCSLALQAARVHEPQMHVSHGILGG